MLSKVFQQARRGEWDSVMNTFQDIQECSKASRYVSTSSERWTFLHHAAFWGNEGAIKRLIECGSDINAEDSDGKTPAIIAAENGKEEISNLISSAAVGSLWEPSKDISTVASSNLFSESRPEVLRKRKNVSYGGGSFELSAGTLVYVDSFNRPLIGWHGSFSPPCGMDGSSMVTEIGSGEEQCLRAASGFP